MNGSKLQPNGTGTSAAVGNIQPNGGAASEEKLATHQRLLEERLEDDEAHNNRVELEGERCRSKFLFPPWRRRR